MSKEQFIKDEEAKEEAAEAAVEQLQEESAEDKAMKVLMEKDKRNREECSEKINKALTEHGFDLQVAHTYNLIPRQ